MPVPEQGQVLAPESEQELALVRALEQALGLERALELVQHKQLKQVKSPAPRQSKH